MSDDYSERISQIRRLTFFKALGSLLRLDDPEDRMKPREALRLLWVYLKWLWGIFVVAVVSLAVTVLYFDLAPNSGSSFFIDWDYQTLLAEFRSNKPHFSGHGFAWVLLVGAVCSLVVSAFYIQRRVIPRFVRSLAICITVASIYMAIVLFALACSQFGVKDTVLNLEKATDRATCLYFSVVTWTTLGYGDVVPTAALRPIAALEAMVGYVCMAVFISAIVAASIKQTWRD